MRVTFVMLGLRSFRSGGYRFNGRMADALARSGHDVDVVHHDTVPARVRGSRLLGSLHVLRRFLRYRPDVLLVSKSYSFMGLLRPVLPLFRGTPVLYLVHHLEWHDRSGAPSRSRRGLVGWFLRAGDAVWTNSRCTADDVAGLGIPRERISVIPPGLERFEADQTGKRPGPPRLLSVGALCPRKDQLTLVRACGLLGERDYRLLLLGDPDSHPGYAKDLVDEAERLSLGEKIRFAGHLSADELHAEYTSSHVLANPSRWEGYGMAVAEALWAGLPVVAADAGAVPELVNDGREGFLVPPGAPEALADRLSRLIDDEGLRREMSAAARRRGEQLYTWEDTEREFVALVESLAPSSRVSRE